MSYIPKVGENCIYQEKGGCRWNIKIDYIGKDIFVGTSDDGFELTDKLAQINPLKTPAEIERDKLISELYGDLVEIDIYDNKGGMAEALVSLGYRKQQVLPLSIEDFGDCPDGINGYRWLVKNSYVIQVGE